MTDLTIPPLPLAILEVHKRLEQRRPMNPSDVSSPFDQASTSPLALWMTDENDPDIPSHIDLGDPATFWWKDVEVTPGRVRTTYGMNAEDNHALGKCFSFAVQTQHDAISFPCCLLHSKGPGLSVQLGTICRNDKKGTQLSDGEVFRQERLTSRSQNLKSSHKFGGWLLKDHKRTWMSLVIPVLASGIAQNSPARNLAVSLMTSTGSSTTQ